MPVQVLVVEDDSDVREAVVDQLEEQVPWIEVSSAGDGLEAHELLESSADKGKLVLVP